MATFLDNLIPLKGRLNHSQLAGWQPIKVAEQGLGCRVEPAVMIPLPDGIRLEADIYLPKKQGKYPAIVQLAAYNKVMHTVGVPKGTNEVGSPPVITGRGYAQVILGHLLEKEREITLSNSQPERFTQRLPERGLCSHEFDRTTLLCPKHVTLRPGDIYRAGYVGLEESVVSNQ